MGHPTFVADSRRESDGSPHPIHRNQRAATTLPFVIPSEAEGPAVRPSLQQRLGAPLPRFPVEACGVDTPPAPFLNERRTREPLCHSVAANRGQALVLGLIGMPQPSTPPVSRRLCGRLTMLDETPVL